METGSTPRSVPVWIHSADTVPLRSWPGAATEIGERHHLATAGGTCRSSVERRSGRQRTLRAGGRHGSRAAQLGQTSLELHVEAAVEDGVDSAVEQRQRLGEGVDRLGDDVAVLCPDVDEMNHEVRRPASDERADDAQRHLQQQPRTPDK